MFLSNESLPLPNLPQVSNKISTTRVNHGTFFKTREDGLEDMQLDGVLNNRSTSTLKKWLVLQHSNECMEMISVVTPSSDVSAEVKQPSLSEDTSTTSSSPTTTSITLNKKTAVRGKRGRPSIASTKLTRDNNVKETSSPIEDDRKPLNFGPIIIDETSKYKAGDAPTVIYAKFHEDLDIIKIHEIVRFRMQCILNSWTEFSSQVEEFLKLSNESRCRVKRIELVENAEKILEEYNTETLLEKWNNYVSKAAPLISEYIRESPEISPEMIPTPFPSSESEYKTRVEIIKEFISVASTCIEINAFPTVNTVKECIACGWDFVLEDSDTTTPPYIADRIDSFGTRLCRCGYQSVDIARAATFRDNSRIDAGAKNSYDDLANFTKRMDAFEGRQRIPPPDVLTDQLIKYIESKNLISGGRTVAEVKDAPLNSSGKKDGTYISIIETALLNTSNSSFYKDIELIANRLFGWRLADLSKNDLRRHMVSDYISTQKIYDEVKERESSLNVNLRLYYHLKARKFPCELEDFKIVSSKESLDYHQRMFNILSKRTGLPEVSIIF